MSFTVNHSLYGYFYIIIMFCSFKPSLCFLLCIFPVTSEAIFWCYNLIMGKEFMERFEWDACKWGLFDKKFLLVRCSLSLKGLKISYVKRLGNMCLQYLWTLSVHSESSFASFDIIQGLPANCHFIFSPLWLCHEQHLMCE